MDKGLVIVVLLCLFVLSSVFVGVAGFFSNWFGLGGTVASSSTPAGVTHTPSSGTTQTAAVSQTAPPFMYVPYFDMPGNDISGSPFTTSDVGGCALKCANTNGCVGISYGPTLKQCFLKNKMGNSNVSISTTTLGFPSSSAIFPSTLTSPGVLNPGMALVSPSQRYALVHQNNGDLVISNLRSGLNVWRSYTSGYLSKPFQLVMQSDSNLVLYDNNKKAIWGSWQVLSPATFVLSMQDDGNLVVYDSNKTALWASHTYGL